ncbi:hypothetical protein ACSSV1_006274 [Labrenzia sp. MBR-25]
MKRTLTLLVATTALTAAVGLPASGAMRAMTDGITRPISAIADAEREGAPLIFVSDDSDDDDDREYRRARSFGGDDDDDDDDDDDCGNPARNPAPAGTISPPQNGLFGSGTPPKVQVN